MTSALRGWPLARWVTCPSGERTNVVGVRRTSSFLTRSSRACASISTWLTPSTIRATSARTCLVPRHGAQNAEENWTRVARVPSATPRSAVLTSPGVTATPDDAARTRPLRARHHRPTAVATASAPTATTSPMVVTAGEQHDGAAHSRLAMNECRPANGVRAPSAGRLLRSGRWRAA